MYQRRRFRALLVILALVGTACGWMQPGFDPGHTSANPVEAILTPSNVPTLEHHTVTVDGSAITGYFIVEHWLIVTTATGTIAYDRTVCPRADNGPCTPVWTRPGAIFRSTNGGILFFSTGNTTFEATDLARNRLWTGMPAQPTGVLPKISGFTISGRHLVVQIATVLGDFSFTRLSVFDTAGCGTSMCSPTREIDSAPYGWAVLGDTLYVADLAGGPTGAGAQDLTTGAWLWNTAHGNPSFQVRDGLLLDTMANDQYDPRGVVNCSGTPKICHPLRHLRPAPLTGTSALGASITVTPTRPVDGTFRASIFANDGTGCSGPLVVCEPLATTTAVGGRWRGVALTPQLVLILGDVLRGFSTEGHLYAFDAKAAARCTGAPKECAPLVDVEISDTSVHDLKVWAGRIYASDSNGVVHVFSLPGDVS